MVRVLNTLLLLITLVGGYFVAQAGTEFEATRKEFARLAAKVGRLPIEDETKVHVLALETEDPLDFAWQVYVPAKFRWKWETTRFQSRISRSTGMIQEPRTELVRVRFRKSDGQWTVWHKMISGSGVASVRDLELLDQPDLRHVQQLGVGKLKVVEPDEVVTLLHITAKQPPGSEARAESAFVGRFGSQAAWAKQQSEGK